MTNRRVKAGRASVLILFAVSSLAVAQTSGFTSIGPSTRPCSDWTKARLSGKGGGMSQEEVVMTSWFQGLLSGMNIQLALSKEEMVPLPRIAELRDSLDTLCLRFPNEPLQNIGAVAFGQARRTVEPKR
jgi:hypothetical protein